MWTRRLLLGIALLGLISGGRSQDVPAPAEAENSVDPRLVPAPAEAENSVTSEESPKCRYTIICPMLMTSNSSSWVRVEMICQEPVNMTLTVEYFDKKNQIFKKENVVNVSDAELILVPTVSKPETALLTFTATGANINMQSRKQIIFDRKQSTCIAQTDKPLYKQGEEINVRWMCYDEDMKVAKKNFTNVTFWDPYGNRVIIDQKPVMDHGVLIWSSKFSPNARPGYYRLEAMDNKGDVQSTNIELRNYELPTWDWTFTCPASLSVLDKKADISGNAQYVFGKPVTGTVFVECCRRMPRYGSQGNCFRGMEDFCYKFNMTLDENGNFSKTLDLERYNLPLSGPENSITCEMTVKEQGTDELLTKSCWMGITSSLANVQLDYEKMGRHYNRGPVPFCATLTDEKGAPISYANITVYIDGRKDKIVTTDKNGKVSYVINTSNHFNANFTVTARYENPDLCYGLDSSQSSPYAEYTLYRLFSMSGSYMRLTGPEGEIPVGSLAKVKVAYMLTKEGLGKGQTKASLLLFVKARGKMVKTKKMTVEVTKGNKGTTTIDLKVDETCATGATLVAIIMLQDEIISDAINLRVGTGFKNQMNLTFTKKVAAPGETVDEIVTATPGSFCGLVGRDMAYRLINSYDYFNAYNIISAMNTWIYNLQYDGYDFEEPEPPCVDPNDVRFCYGGWYAPQSWYTDGETYNDVLDNSFIILSNSNYRRRKVCGEPKPAPIRHLFKAAAMAARVTVADQGGSSTITTMRDDLRSTFGYMTTITNAEGISKVSVKLPQTISEWESMGFCLSPETGIGLPAEPAKIKTFMVFFVSTQVPSDVIKGESIVMVITAFNYMEHCAMVKAGIQPSENGDFETKSADDKGEQCACKGQSVFWHILVTFNKTGSVNISAFAETTKISSSCDGPNDDTQSQRKDVMVLNVAVTPAGIQRESSSSHVISVSDSASSITVSVPTPINLEPSTLKLYVTCTGDPVALSVRYIENLLNMPSGCCEQQQSLMRTTALIANYLDHMGQLDRSTLDRVKNKLTQGYLDQLACYIGFGKFSLYRSSNIGNTLVTIYTLHTLIKISPYTYTDPDLISQIIANLGSNQDVSTGCIKSEGTSLQVQNNDNFPQRLNAIVAYMLVPLLQKYSTAAAVFTGAMKCVDSVDFASVDTMTQVYFLNAYSANNQWEKWQENYNIVKEKLITKDGKMYLVDKEAMSGVFRFFPGMSSNELMNTAILLTSMTSHPNPSQEHQDTMAALAITLAGQANRRGTFVSTLDTAETMEALTRYGKRYGYTVTNANITVTDTEKKQLANFTITDDKKFLVNTTEVEPKPGNYTFTVTGTGRIFCQLSANFYTRIVKGAESPFELIVTSQTKECSDAMTPVVTVTISVRYIGKNSECGMSVVGMRTLTGHIIYYKNSELLNPSGICEIESFGSWIYFYIDKLTSTPITWTLTLNPMDRVRIMQKSNVYITTFGTGESGSAEYGHPCYHNDRSVTTT